MPILRIFLKDANKGIFQLAEDYSFSDEEAQKLIDEWKEQPNKTPDTHVGTYKCRIVTRSTSRSNEDITLMLRFKDVAAIG